MIGPRWGRGWDLSQGPGGRQPTRRLLGKKVKIAATALTADKESVFYIENTTELYPFAIFVDFLILLCAELWAFATARPECYMA